MKKYLNKLISIIISVCFLISFVAGPTMANALSAADATAQYKQIFSNFVLPYSFGQITSAHYGATDRVLINIQDLHSHPKVQKNISNIIELFDKKYGVNKVFLEGAYGQVSTKWIDEKTNKRNKNKILDMMLETGRLTGAEYYSAKSDKTEIIEGLEKKEPYLDNLKRFGQLLEEQEKIEEILKAISESTKELKEKYYGKRQKKIEKLSQDYKDNKITSKKYYTLLAKHIDKLGIDINKYENTLAYIMLLELQKGLDYSKITRELQNLVYVLKGQLPYNAYKKLLEHTDNFTRTDSLYAYIIQIARIYNLDLSVNFSNLDKYFRYIELSQKINPIELIAEEDKLRHEINTRFSETKAQRDVVFLTDFEKYLRDYITTKITSGDYQYYKDNIEDYKTLYNKYVDNRVLSLLDAYIKEVDNFYEINNDRNIYFTDSLFAASSSSLSSPSASVGDLSLSSLRGDVSTKQSTARSAVIADSDPQSMLNKKTLSPVIASETTSSVAIQSLSSDNSQPSALSSSAAVNKILDNMKDVKTVDIVITGGFHSQTVTDILKDHGVSYIVITPNVTDGVKLAEETYHNIVKEQSRISFQTLASLISSLSIVDQIKILRMAGITDEELNGIYSPQQLEEASKQGKKADDILKEITPKVMKLAGILESDEFGDIKERTLKILKDRVGQEQKEIVNEELLNKIDTEKLKGLLEDEDITKLQKVITTVSKDSTTRQAADIIIDMAETIQKAAQKYSVTIQAAKISAEIVIPSAEPSVEQKERLLQTKRTKDWLRRYAEERGYENPEEFQNTLRGKMLGVWHEMLPFWNIFSIHRTIFGKKIDINSFVKEHENPTMSQIIAIWVIRALTIGVGVGTAAVLATAVSPLAAFFGIPAALATEFTTHLAWNTLPERFREVTNKETSQATEEQKLQRKIKLVDILYTVSPAAEEIFFRAIPAFIATINLPVGIALFFVSQPLFIFSHAIIEWLINKDSGGIDFRQAFKNLSPITGVLSFPYLANIFLFPGVSPIAATLIATLVHYANNRAAEPDAVRRSLENIKNQITNLDNKETPRFSFLTGREKRREEALKQKAVELFRENKKYLEDELKRREAELTKELDELKSLPMSSVEIFNKIQDLEKRFRTLENMWVEKDGERHLKYEELTEEQLTNMINEINKYGNLFERLDKIAERISKISGQERIDLERDFLDLIENIVCESLAKLYNDEITKEHVRRVTKYAIRMDKYFDAPLNLKGKKDLLVSALMHDIGKSLVPDKDILNFPDRLSNEQFLIMSGHVWMGARILMGSIFGDYTDVLQVAAKHHEVNNYTAESLTKDESFKYPQEDKLSEKVAVSDIFEAVSSYIVRPYQYGGFIAGMKDLLGDSTNQRINEIKKDRLGAEIVESLLNDIRNIENGNYKISSQDENFRNDWEETNKELREANNRLAELEEELSHLKTVSSKEKQNIEEDIEKLEEQIKAIEHEIKDLREYQKNLARADFIDKVMYRKDVDEKREEILAKIRKEQRKGKREFGFKVVAKVNINDVLDYINRLTGFGEEEFVNKFKQDKDFAKEWTEKIFDFAKDKSDKAVSARDKFEFPESEIKAFIQFYFNEEDVAVNDSLIGKLSTLEFRSYVLSTAIQKKGRILGIMVQLLPFVWLQNFFGNLFGNSANILKPLKDSLNPSMPNIQEASAKLATGMDRETAMVDGKQESMVVTEYEEEAIDLVSKGIKAVVVRSTVEDSRGNGAGQIENYKGIPVRVEIRTNKNGVQELVFKINQESHPEINIADIDVYNELVPLLSSTIDKNEEGRKDIKGFEGITRVISSSNTEGINKIKNEKTSAITLPGKDFKQDMTKRKDVKKGSLSNICARESEATDSKIFILTAEQANECRQEIENLQNNGYRFIINYDKSSDVSEIMFDGAKINAEDINSVEKAKEFLRKLRELKLSKGIDTQISVRFSNEIYLKLNMDIFNEYGIIPIADISMSEKITGKKEIEDTIDEKKFENMLRDDNVVSIVIDEDSKEFISKNKDRIRQAKSALTKYKKGANAAQSSKFDYTANTGRLMDIINSGILSADLQKAQTEIGKLNFALFSPDAQTYLEYLQSKERYEEMLGFVRGVVLRTVAQEITKLETINIEKEDFLAAEMSNTVQAILIMTVQHMANGKTLEALFTQVGGSDVMTAEEYLSSIRSTLNGAMDEVLRKNETKIDTSTEALMPFDGIPELLMDSYRPRSSVGKDINISIFAVKSMLSAA